MLVWSHAQPRLAGPILPALRVRGAPRKKQPFDHLEYAIALGATIDERELRRMPRDGAKNFDHYLDGSPRQD